MSYTNKACWPPVEDLSNPTQLSYDETISRIQDYLEKSLSKPHLHPDCRFRTGKLFLRSHSVKNGLVLGRLRLVEAGLRGKIIASSARARVEGLINYRALLPHMDVPELVAADNGDHGDGWDNKEIRRDDDDCWDLVIRRERLRDRYSFEFTDEEWDIHPVRQQVRGGSDEFHFFGDYVPSMKRLEYETALAMIDAEERRRIRRAARRERARIKEAMRELPMQNTELPSPDSSEAENIYRPRPGARDHFEPLPKTAVPKKSILKKTNSQSTENSVPVPLTRKSLEQSNLSSVWPILSNDDSAPGSLSPRASSPANSASQSPELPSSLPGAVNSSSQNSTRATEPVSNIESSFDSQKINPQPELPGLNSDPTLTTSQGLSVAREPVSFDESRSDSQTTNLQAETPNSTAESTLSTAGDVTSQDPQTALEPSAAGDSTHGPGAANIRAEQPNPFPELDLPTAQDKIAEAGPVDSQLTEITSPGASQQEQSRQQPGVGPGQSIDEVDSSQLSTMRRMLSGVSGRFWRPSTRTWPSFAFSKAPSTREVEPASNLQKGRVATNSAFRFIFPSYNPSEEGRRKSEKEARNAATAAAVTDYILSSDSNLEPPVSGTTTTKRTPNAYLGKSPYFFNYLNILSQQVQPQTPRHQYIDNKQNKPNDSTTDVNSVAAAVFDSQETQDIIDNQHQDSLDSRILEPKVPTQYPSAPVKLVNGTQSPDKSPLQNGDSNSEDLRTSKRKRLQEQAFRGANNHSDEEELEIVYESPPNAAYTSLNRAAKKAKVNGAL